MPAAVDVTGAGSHASEQAHVSSARVSVALTVASLAPEHGGPSRSVPNLRDALVSAGARAEVVTPTSAWGFGRDLQRYMRECDIRLVHDNGVWLPSNHAAVAAARTLAVPAVVSPRGMLEPWSMRHRAWKKRLAWWGYQHRDLDAAALLHATSTMEADQLRALGLRAPVAIIPNGVDVPELQYKAVEHDAHVAVFLSRVHPKKGLLNLVRAWSAVRPKHWRVVIAGPDERGHTAEVVEAVHAAGLDSTFSFVGAVEGDAKLRLLQGADLFVLPTFSENFGLVVAEALANALPVITTTGAPWSGLASEACGWWVDVGVDPLVDALRRATDLSDAERAAMGARGREWVRREFAWPRIGREMLAAYEWVLRGGPTPASVRHA